MVLMFWRTMRLKDRQIEVSLAKQIQLSLDFIPHLFYISDE